MKGWPLRLKVTLWSVMVGALALLLFGGVVGVSLRRSTLSHMDSELRHESEDFFVSLREHPSPNLWQDQEEVRELFGLVRSLYTFDIEQPPGKSVYRTRSLGNTPLPSGSDDVPFTTTIDGQNVRVLQVTRNGVRIRVAADLDPIEQIESTLWITYAGLVPITLLFIALGGMWLSRKALSPVEQITAAAEHITAQRLEHRLPSPGTNDEIGRLTDVLNEMIARIRVSFEQARRFSADASHELKTPLTIIRGEIEASLRADQLPPALERTMLDLLEETSRLIYIVESLLILSQADAGKFTIELSPLEFTAFLDELIEDVEILATPRGITLSTEFEPGVQVNANVQFLRQVLLNLFDNAVKYNLPNGEIRARLVSSNGQAVFTICNTGANISSEDRTRIFDRFHRADRSRERATGGQGLGLSICREIIRAHGGEISLEPSDHGWTCFRFSLPLCEAPAPGV